MNMMQLIRFVAIACAMIAATAIRTSNASAVIGTSNASVQAVQGYEYPDFNLSANGDSVTVNQNPVTFFVGDKAFAYTQSAEYLYYVIHPCDGGSQGHEKGVLTVSLPGNVEWSTFGKGWVTVQISKCAGSFSEECVFAQNYDFSESIGIPQIVWTLDPNVDAFYIRAMAMNTAIMFSMELSFQNDVPDVSYPWATNSPFNGEIANKAPQTLLQYWRLQAEYMVRNTDVTDEYLFFALGFCHQSVVHADTTIQVSLVAPADAVHSLLEQWACPQTIPVENCNNGMAIDYGWVNSKAAMANTLNCVPQSNRPTAEGIFVVVSGWGANLDLQNRFYLSAVAI